MPHSLTLHRETFEDKPVWRITGFSHGQSVRCIPNDTGYGWSAEVVGADYGRGQFSSFEALLHALTQIDFPRPAPAPR